MVEVEARGNRRNDTLMVGTWTYMDQGWLDSLDGAAWSFGSKLPLRTMTFHRRCKSFTAKHGSKMMLPKDVEPYELEKLCVSGIGQ